MLPDSFPRQPHWALMSVKMFRCPCAWPSHLEFSLRMHFSCSLALAFSLSPVLSYIHQESRWFHLSALSTKHPDHVVPGSPRGLLCVARAGPVVACFPWYLGMRARLAPLVSEGLMNCWRWPRWSQTKEAVNCSAHCILKANLRTWCTLEGWVYINLQYLSKWVTNSFSCSFTHTLDLNPGS